jgi:anti-sigma B factor antagonist
MPPVSAPLALRERARALAFGVGSSLVEADQQLSMQVAEQDGVCTLALVGELDMATAPEFRERLLGLFADGFRQVVIDLGELAYVDSVGLGVLVGGLKRYREAAGDLHLRRPQGQVSQVLDLTGVSQLFQNRPGDAPAPGV